MLNFYTMEVDGDYSRGYKALKNSGKLTKVDPCTLNFPKQNDSFVLGKHSNEVIFHKTFLSWFTTLVTIHLYGKGITINHTLCVSQN